MDYLGKKFTTEPLVITIDELPYLGGENNPYPSYLQLFVNERLRETDSMLVLFGSSVSTMEPVVLSHESPLYGRRMGQIEAQSLSFQQARDIVAYDIEDAIRLFAVTSVPQCTSLPSTTIDPRGEHPNGHSLSDSPPLRQPRIPSPHRVTEPCTVHEYS